MPGWPRHAWARGGCHAPCMRRAATNEKEEARTLRFQPEESGFFLFTRVFEVRIIGISRISSYFVLEIGRRLIV